MIRRECAEVRNSSYYKKDLSHQFIVVNMRYTFVLVNKIRTWRHLCFEAKRCNSPNDEQDNDDCVPGSKYFNYAYHE